MNKIIKYFFIIFVSSITLSALILAGIGLAFKFDLSHLKVEPFGGKGGENGNLIYNSGFETGDLSGWLFSGRGCNPNSATCKVVSDAFHSGNYSYQTTFFKNKTLPDVEIWRTRQDISIKPNTVYELSFWAKTDNDRNGASTITAIFFDGSNKIKEIELKKIAWNSSFPDDHQDKNRWLKTHAIFTTPSNSNKLRISIRAYDGWNSSEEIIGTTWWDDFELKAIPKVFSDTHLWIAPPDYRVFCDATYRTNSSLSYMDNLLTVLGQRNIIGHVHFALARYSFASDLECFKKFLEQAKNKNVKIWLNFPENFYYGGPVDYNKFLDNTGGVRDEILSHVGQVIKTYNDYATATRFSRITIFGEAPHNYNDFWNPGGGKKYCYDLPAAVNKIPSVFNFLSEKIKSTLISLPNSKIGIWLAGSCYVDPENFTQLLMSPWNNAQRPDFFYIDWYRGKGSTPEQADWWIERVIRSAANFNIPVFFEGQMHTSSNGYTPSKNNINSDISTGIRAGTKGVGFELRNYESTSPNLNQQEPAFIINNIRLSEVYESSRDRWEYASLRLFEQQKPNFNDLFDVWIYGSDFDRYELELYLKSNLGEWDFMGRFSPTPKQNIYNGKDHVVIFRALPKSKYMANSIIELKIVDPVLGWSDGSVLHDVYLMPYSNTDNFITEEDAITNLASYKSRALYYKNPEKNIVNGETFTIEIEK